MTVIYNVTNFPKKEGDTTTPFLFHLVETVARQDLKIIVLAPHASGAKKKQQRKNVVIHRFQYAWPQSAQQLFGTGGAVANLRHRPLNYLVLPSLIITQLISLVRLTQRYRPAVIHTHGFLPQALAGHLVSRLFQIPHIIHLHGSGVFAFNAAPVKWLKQLLLAHCQAVIFNTPFLKENAQKLIGHKVTHSHIIPTPVYGTKKNTTPKPATIRQKYQLNPRATLGLFVARLVPEKGAGVLIKAVHHLPDSLKKNCQIALVGSGPQQTVLAAAIKKYQLEKNLKLIGWLNSGQLYHLYRSADFYIGLSLPSREGAREAQGLTYLEALAAGLPTVSPADMGFISLFTETELATLPLTRINPPITVPKVKKTLQSLLNNSLQREPHPNLLKRVSLEEVATQTRSLYHSLSSSEHGVRQ